MATATITANTAITTLLVFRLSRDSVNMRAAFLHNLADAMGAVAVIIAGTLILAYDWRPIDPIVTLMISACILWHAGQGLRPVIRILMPGAADGIDLPDLIIVMETAPPDAANIHPLHPWHMQEHAATLEGADPETVKSDLKSLLRVRFCIAHSVPEPETAPETCPYPQVIGPP